MRYQCQKCLKTFPFPKTIRSGNENQWSEYETCPYCSSIDITEYTETQPEINSVKSVDISQVDDYLKLGYTVKELYAKTATLIKTATKEKQQ